MRIDSARGILERRAGFLARRIINIEADGETTGHTTADRQELKALETMFEALSLLPPVIPEIPPREEKVKVVPWVKGDGRPRVPGG